MRLIQLHALEWKEPSMTIRACTYPHFMIHHISYQLLFCCSAEGFTVDIS